MLLKPQIPSSSKIDVRMIDLRVFDNALIEELIKRRQNSQGSFVGSLYMFNKDVGVIMIKYLSQTNAEELKNIFLHEKLL